MPPIVSFKPWAHKHYKGHTLDDGHSPYLVKVCEGFVLLYQHLGKLQALFRVHAHDVA